MSKKRLKRPMPLERKILASPEDYSPISSECKVIGAFNPGATFIENSQGELETLLMVRVAEAPSINLQENVYKDYLLLPFFEVENKYKTNELKMSFDRVLDKDLVHEGKKEVELKNGVRLKHISLPRFIKLNENGEVIERNQNPAIYPSFEYERFGIEDVRITPFEDERFILTYVTPHRFFGVSTPFLITKDFKHYTRLPEGNTPRPIMTGIKDVIIFPEKVISPSRTETIRKGKRLYVGFIRPNAFHDVSKPGIWISYSPDLIHWGQGHRLTSIEVEATGSGTPPIRVEEHWLAAYHETTKNPRNELTYSTKLMRMDAAHPWKGFKKSQNLLKREDYRKMLENKKGYVPNVVFTSGITEKNGITTFYSGLDDTWTVSDKFYTEDLTKFLKKD